MARIHRVEGDDVTRRQRTYQNAIRSEFAFLKETCDLRELYVKAIELGSNMGYLLPLCELHAHDVEVIKFLSRWRDENSFAYPTQFPVTEEGTASWLRTGLLDVEDRILFIIANKTGTPIGHIGYANCVNEEMIMEMDNVVRGVKTGDPGIITEAARTIIRWAHEQFGPEGLSLRVFDDNEHAIRFYQNVGFVSDSRIPLRMMTKGRNISYVPVEGQDTVPPDKSFLRMVYAPETEFTGEELILTAGPSISAREAAYVLDAVYRGWNHQWRKYIGAFEEGFADYVGAKFALSTSSCTGALHIALAALGIGPGDEVIVPDLTWVATANAVLYVGAIPVFADIQPDTWCIDADSVRELVTEQTKAIIPVHLYGHPAEMGPILDIAQQHGLYVVEDAAPAVGAEYEGKRTGAFGHFGAFSFQGAKLMVTGEGGMLVCKDEELYQRAFKIWDQGRVPGSFWIDTNGVKYKMANVQAAIGLGQLERIQHMIEAKRRIFSWYQNGLLGVPGIRLNQEAAWARSIYWMTSIELDDTIRVTRDELREKLKARNIDTRSVFPTISQYPHWPRHHAPQPAAEGVAQRGMNLPSGGCLTREKVDHVCRAIRDILQSAQ